MPPLSRWAQTRRFMGDPISLLTEGREACGDVFMLNFLGLGPWIFVSSPEAVREVFKAPRDVLGAGDIHYRMLGGLFGRHAIFTLDGEPHRQRQRLVMPKLNGAVVDEYVDLMVQVAEKAADSWTLGNPFSMLPIAHRMALDILVGIVFGQHDTERSRRLSDQFHRFSEDGTRSLLIRMPWLQIDLGRYSPWGRVLRLRDETREVFRRALHDATERTPMLDALMGAGEEQQVLSDDDRLDEITTLLFAGHETTGTVLTWALESVLSRPKVYDR
ncbi:MAG: cytochrome P450, partial [Acidobacteriota bacterium]